MIQRQIRSWEGKTRARNNGTLWWCLRPELLPKPGWIKTCSSEGKAYSKTCTCSFSSLIQWLCGYSQLRRERSKTECRRAEWAPTRSCCSPPCPLQAVLAWINLEIVAAEIERQWQWSSLKPHSLLPSPGGTVGRENRGCGCEGIVRPWQDRTGFTFCF